MGVQGRPSEQLTEYSETWGLQTLWDSERQALQWELGKLSTSQRALRGGGRAGEGTPSEEVTPLSVLKVLCIALGIVNPCGNLPRSLSSPHLTDRRKEIQRSKRACSVSHGLQTMEQGLNSGYYCPLDFVTFQ